MDETLSGQKELFRDERTEAIEERVRSRPASSRSRDSKPPSDLVAVHTDRVSSELARECGPVHVGHQMWLKLEAHAVLREAGISERARLLTEVMVLNRLIAPCSEHAMPDWTRRTALEDLLPLDFEHLDDDTLYRNMDRLHPERARIERGLSERERTLFDLDDQIYLYDLTSTYFEGQCPVNPQAKRGYSRDKRPDCKQVVVGLVINREGFPRAHEVFDGNRVDTTTVDEMLTALEQRTEVKPGATVVVDRGMAYKKNLKQIRSRGYHYLVASRQEERLEHYEEYVDESGWQEILREPSPRNPGQKKSRVFIKRGKEGEETYVLCRSEGREEKDKAIREKHEEKLLADLEQLKKRIQKGDAVEEPEIHEAIGRLKERYPRVARYWEISYDSASRALSYQENAHKKQTATKLDGAYQLRTDRKDLDEDEIWRTYILLTRAEAAFRAMKSPLQERPIFHHLKNRVQTHIFLCVLAYHLLVAIEKMFLDRGIHTSWATLREELSTHQVVTIVLPTSTGEVLRIRRATRPEPRHQEIYRVLAIPEEVMKPRKTWSKPG
jgi:transposase